MITARVYYGTGFNLLNIPKNSAVLEAVAGSTKDFSALDLINPFLVDHVDLRANVKEVQGADYIKLSDTAGDAFYYKVTGFSMLAGDIARLHLLPDFLTSAGGPAALHYLDGVTERHHVSLAKDTFGSYSEADPLLIPACPLELIISPFLFQGEDLDAYEVVESSVDLYTLGGGTAYDADTYTDANGLTVTVPKMPALNASQFTTFNIAGRTVRSRGTALFDVSNAQVQKGLQIARDLGIEQSVTAQYGLPFALFTINTNNGLVTDVISATIPQQLGAAFNYDEQTSHNMRVQYGELNKYGIITAQGNRSEFNPEEIYNAQRTAPAVIAHADGRHDGKAYFSFDTFRGNDMTIFTPAFFMNAIEGAGWRNIPLVYTQTAGNVQDTYMMRSASEISRARQTLGTVNSVMSASSGLMSMGSPFNGVNAEGQIMFNGFGLTNAVFRSTMGIANAIASEELYKAQAAQDLAQFGMSHSYVSPELLFPPVCQTLRDYFGNGATAYRYRPAYSDQLRFDKILTAYGYKITEALDSSMFDVREKFSFVKTSSVTISDDLPGWWKDGITSQLGTGVRVWKVKPDPSIYSAGQS